MSRADHQLGDRTAAAEILLRVAEVLAVLTLPPRISITEAANPAQLRLLRAVSDHADDRRGGMYLSQVARQLGRHPSTVTRACNRLGAAGLLSCCSDPHDRRRLRVRLTPAGQALVGGMAGRSRAAVLEVLARMSEEDVTALAAAVDGFVRAAGDTCVGRGPEHVPASGGGEPR